MASHDPPKEPEDESEYSFGPAERKRRENRPHGEGGRYTGQAPEGDDPNEAQRR